MQTYSRLPAVLVLATLAAAGGIYAFGIRHSGGGDAPSLAQLEVAIAAPAATGETWLQYAQRLQEQHRHAHAAAAYRKAVELLPGSTQARIGLVLSLAEANNKDALHAELTDLVYGDPKLALDLFEKKACAAHLKDPRFADLLKEARRQVMD